MWLLERTPKVGRAWNPGYETYYLSGKYKDLEDLEHPELVEILPPKKWEKAIVVGLESPSEEKPSGHYLHAHTHDLGRDMGRERYHVVLKTNPDCLCWNGDGEPQHLEDRGVYWMEPYLPHESVNNGASDRLHIILVAYV